jgi:hypothetical protein
MKTVTVAEKAVNQILENTSRIQRQAELILRKPEADPAFRLAIITGLAREIELVFKQIEQQQ